MKTRPRTFPALMAIAVGASALVFARGASAQDDKGKKSPVLAVVGDIACQPTAEPAGEAGHETCVDPKAPYNTPGAPYYLWLSQEATANQIEAMKPDLVALVGDLQYQVGQYTDFTQSFDLTYGGFKYLHRPSPGNHEFYSEHGETGVAGYGYFSYYNGFQIDGAGKPITKVIQDPCPTPIAGCSPGTTPPDTLPQPIPRQDGQAGHFGDTGNGWYSYNLGSWHLISLNIQCGTQPGSCSDTGAWFAEELEWLEKDLERNKSACTLAYWHQPTYSAANSLSTEGATAQAFWRLLYEHGADVVLNGHDHLYARYRPLDPNGNPDSDRGIREFIVGTGGETLDPVSLTGTSSNPGGDNLFNTHNLEASTGNFWGVMGLTLDKKGYRWDFESALAIPGGPGGNFSDKGSATCHRGNNGDNDDQR